MDHRTRVVNSVITKGHFSNLNVVDATEHLLSEKVLTGFKEVKVAIPGKATLRYSDYRKAMILFYLKLKETNADQTIANVFKIAVHLSHTCMLYTSDYHLTPKPFWLCTTYHLSMACCAFNYSLQPKLTY